MSDGQRRRWGLLSVGLLLLALVVLGPPAASTLGSDQAAQGDAEAFAEAMAEGRAHTVSPHPNSSMAIWPYTSRGKSVRSATLPINVVVLADVDLVRTTLIHRPDAEWEDQRHGLNGTASTQNSSAEERTPTPNASGAGTATPPNGTGDASNSSVRDTSSTAEGTNPGPNASVDAGARISLRCDNPRRWRQRRADVMMGVAMSMAQKAPLSVPQTSGMTEILGSKASVPADDCQTNSGSG